MKTPEQIANEYYELNRYINDTEEGIVEDLIHLMNQHCASIPNNHIFNLNKNVWVIAQNKNLVQVIGYEHTEEEGLSIIVLRGLSVERWDVKEFGINALLSIAKAFENYS